MPSAEKIFQDIMNGTKDKNIKFKDLQKLLDTLNFKFRIKGDHFVYYKNGIDEIINIQPDGNKAKPYQIKQVRLLIKRYNLEV